MSRQYKKLNFSLGSIPFDDPEHGADKIVARLGEICTKTMGNKLDTKQVSKCRMTTDSGSNML